MTTPTRPLRPLLAALLAAAPAAQSDSEQPPPGAPWTTDFAAAHRQAITSGKPIFVYSTKTH